MFLAATLALLAGGPAPAIAARTAEIDIDVDAALAKLYREIPSAERLAHSARAVLVFPNVVKGGLMVGGQYGDGALRSGGRTVGYYNLASVSYGFQAGAQSFSYVLLFMTDSALQYLMDSDGWEIGVGPSVVVLDDGLAKTVSTTTAKDDVYAFIYGQKGLMAGIGLQGSKITKIRPQ